MALACLGVSKHSRRGVIGHFGPISGAQRRQSIDVDLFRSQSDNHHLLSPMLRFNNSFVAASGDEKGRIKQSQRLIAGNLNIPPLNPPIEVELRAPTTAGDGHYADTPCIRGAQDKAVSTFPIGH